MERADKTCARPHLHTVSLRKGHPAVQPVDGIHEGHGIVEGPEGVDAHVEARIGHAYAHIVCEAAAQEHDPAGVRQADRAGSAIYLGLKFKHRYGLFLQKYGKDP